MIDTVSIIITVLNGEPWISNCLKSIRNQIGCGRFFNLELCIFDDNSKDNTLQMLFEWQQEFQSRHFIEMKIVQNETGSSCGVGYGRNKAISISTGEYLCFQDIDDIMIPDRIFRQLKVAKGMCPNTLIGGKVIRVPINSTQRFARWANNLPQDKLGVQVYTSHGPTVLMPTWFCHRSVFERIGAFVSGFGVPEDLVFFYRHLDQGGQLCRVNDVMVHYTFHPNATTFSVHEDTIWKIRLERLIRCVLVRWKEGFTIWNAGKQGRKFYKSLPFVYQTRVKSFCDVDQKKIGKTYRFYDKHSKKETCNVPIVHFSQAEAPFVICVKIDMTGGDFENNLQSLKLMEGKDYVLFS